MTSAGSHEASQVTAVTGWLDALPRWLGMLGAIVLMGLLTASRVFWRRQLPDVPPPAYVLPWLAVLLLASSLMLSVRLQRLPVDARGWVGLGTLLSSSLGLIDVARLGVAVLLVGVLVGYWWMVGARTWCWALALVLSLLLVASDVLVSHSAATPVWKGLALSAAGAHLLGVALWLGGLWYFATLFWYGTFREPSAASELAWAIPAFSILAVGAVGLLTMSGLYLARMHLGSLTDLLSTTYGRILLGKLCVVGVMVALGGYHQFIVHRRIVTSADVSDTRAHPSSQRFRHTLRLEALLGLLALLLASILGSTSPPSTLPAHADQTFRQTRAVGDAQVAIEVKPLRPGPNDIRLVLTGHDGQPLSDATGALLQMQAAASETAPIGITLRREAPGIFGAKDLLLGMEGSWKGQLMVQRQGAYDLHDHFELTLTSHTDQHAPPPSSMGMHLAIALAYLGIAAGTGFLLMMSIRRLRAALRRLAVSNQHHTSSRDRREGHELS
jgi:putative copper export protein